MPLTEINGVNIYLDEFGAGDPLVLVHGSWVDHMEWPLIVPLLSPRFRVTVYDRRGHGQSERLPTQGSIHEDVADLAVIIERVGAPAHVLGSSFGGSISLRLAATRPELIRTLNVHEPPLFELLLEDPQAKPLMDRLDEEVIAVVNDAAAGNSEDAARRFVESVVLGPGAWDSVMPDVAKQTLLHNAPTFLDECRDRDAGFGRFEPAWTGVVTKLADFARPLLMTGGSASPPLFAAVLDKLAAVLPNAKRKTFQGAGHIPHVTHPQEYAAAVTEFIDSASS